MDNQTNQSKSISEQIILAAKSGKLKMRPKWHFILTAILWMAGVVAVSLTLLYLLSLFLFITHRTGLWVAPMFGLRGILIFLASIPWLLVLAVVIFVVILEILVRHYSFAYRLPLLYSALGVLLVVVIGGLALAGTPLHDMLSHCPRPGLPAGGQPGVNGNIPCGTGFYSDLGPGRLESIHKGVISGLDGGEFVLTNGQREELTIIVTKRTRLPFGEDFSEGDTVVVIGDRHGNRVEAFGISKTNN